MNGQAMTVCPFCPLACDDIEFTTKPESPLLKVSVDCPLARERFRDAMNPSPGRIGDRLASTGELKQHLSKLCDAAENIVVITDGVDLATSRTLEQLQTDQRIKWLLSQSPLSESWQRTVSRDGMISSTLGDIRAHADLLWFLGNPQAKSPRIEHFLLDRNRLAQQIHSQGNIDLDFLAEVALATRSNDTPVTPRARELAVAIKESRYFAIVIGDDAFDARMADAGLSLLIQWLWRLNATNRAVALHMDSAATSRAVHRWRTNRSLASSTGACFAANTLVVRIGDAIQQTPATNVLLASSDPGPDYANVFLPMSILGIHHAGVIIRGDGTVTLPLSKIASSEYPTALQWLSESLTESAT